MLNRSKMIETMIWPSTSGKKVVAAIDSGNKESAGAAYAAAVPVIDRMADKGIIHKNKAARHKARLNAQVKALA